MTLTANWSRQSGSDRTEEYRTWRTTLGQGCVCDVDQIEYKFRDGVLVPCAIVELCVADQRSDEIPAGVPPNQPPSPNFLKAVEAKACMDRPQGKLLRLVAATLKVPLLLVVYVDGRLPDGLWVFRVDGSKGWRKMSREEYMERLGKL